MHAVFPGSFDPPTHGHVDVIGRAARIFGQLTVLVAVNPDKQPWLSAERRVQLLTAACAQWPNVRVDSCRGLVTQYMRERGGEVLVKGVRNAADLELERDQADTNRLAGGVETVFLLPRPEHATMSSSLARQIHRMGGDIGPFVPAGVLELLEAGR